MSGSGRTSMTPEQAAAVLGVPVSASKEEIERAHKTMLELHPDRLPEEQRDAAEQVMARVNWARDVLLKSRPSAQPVERRPSGREDAPEPPEPRVYRRVRSGFVTWSSVDVHEGPPGYPPPPAEPTRVVYQSRELRIRPTQLGLIFVGGCLTVASFVVHGPLTYVVGVLWGLFAVAAVVEARTHS